MTVPNDPPTCCMIRVDPMFPARLLVAVGMEVNSRHRGTARTALTGGGGRNHRPAADKVAGMVADPVRRVPENCPLYTLVLNR